MTSSCQWQCVVNDGIPGLSSECKCRLRGGQEGPIEVK
jgi:hypothetical protein